MKKMHSNMKALEWSQYFSQYKSVCFFPDSQVQLHVTPQYPDFEFIRDLRLFVLLASMKKIRSKMKCSQESVDRQTDFQTDAVSMGIL